MDGDQVLQRGVCPQGHRVQRGPGIVKQEILARLQKQKRENLKSPLYENILEYQNYIQCVLSIMEPTITNISVKQTSKAYKNMVMNIMRNNNVS